MVKVREDLTGRIFGKLKVLEQTEDYIRPSNGQHEARWLCECSCEKHTKLIVSQNQLKNGKTKSCGCSREEGLHRLRKKYNKYDISGAYGIGWTSNTNKEFYFDLDKYEKIKNICWFEHFSSENFSTLLGYIPSLKKEVKMHIFLGYKEYDHIDHNELNNLSNNLRPATHQENQCNKSIYLNNTSGVTGVSWNSSKQKWISQIQFKKQHYYLGAYDSKDEAIKARLIAENDYFGEFAPQQYLYELYEINTNQYD